MNADMARWRADELEAELRTCKDSLPVGNSPEIPDSSDIVQRLLNACNGHPDARILWPYWLFHDAAARIRELEAENAWRPIETAPKDEPILAGGWLGEQWIVARVMVDPPSVTGFALLINGEQSDEGPMQPQPTHWRPLPKPPLKSARN